MKAALAPLHFKGIHVLNYLNDWCILAQSRDMAARNWDAMLATWGPWLLELNPEKCALLFSDNHNITPATTGDHSSFGSGAGVFTPADTCSGSQTLYHSVDKTPVSQLGSNCWSHSWAFLDSYPSLGTWECPCHSWHIYCLELSSSAEAHSNSLGDTIHWCAMTTLQLSLTSTIRLVCICIHYTTVWNMSYKNRISILFLWNINSFIFPSILCNDLEYYFTEKQLHIIMLPPLYFTADVVFFIYILYTTWTAEIMPIPSVARYTRKSTPEANKKLFFTRVLFWLLNSNCSCQLFF